MDQIFTLRYLRYLSITCTHALNRSLSRWFCCSILERWKKENLSLLKSQEAPRRKSPSALSGWWHFKPGLKALAGKFKWIWPFSRKFHRFFDIFWKRAPHWALQNCPVSNSRRKAHPTIPAPLGLFNQKSLAKFTVALRGDYSYSSSSYHSEIESIHIHMGSIYFRSLRLLISARENR